MTDSSTPREIHVAFCGGGSGGHLMPAAAVFQTLRSVIPQARASFVCSGRPGDIQILRSELPEAVEWHPTRRRQSGETTPQISVCVLPLTSGLQTRRPLRTAGAILKSIRVAKRFLRERQPNVVLGTGGFASYPGVRAAAAARIPIVLLECNRVTGRANRRLLPCAAALACGFPLSDDSDYSRTRIRITGVPVRDAFRTETDRPKQPDVTADESGVLRLLILGGSQGSQSVNQLATGALQLSDLQQPLEIVHQTGSSDHERAQTEWRRLISAQSGRLNVRCTPFIDNVPQHLREADLVICRAGAGTLAETAAIGPAAVLIPLSRSADRHQQKNAEWFAEHNAAFVVNESDPEAATCLADLIVRLLNDRELRRATEERLRKLSAPNAAADISGMLLDAAGVPGF